MIICYNVLQMDIQPIDVLKWLGLALAAGFIGYFGRYPAKLLLDRINRKKAQSTPTPKSIEEASASQDRRLEESRLKLEKKKAKQEVKRAKKASKS